MNILQISLAFQILLPLYLEITHTKQGYETVTKFLVMKLSTFFKTPVDISQKLKFQKKVENPNDTNLLLTAISGV